MRLENIRDHILMLKGKGISFFEKIRLHTRKRHHPYPLNFFGKTLSVTDAGSMLAMYTEIFLHHNYQFPTDNQEPLIIDCGANIGLGIIYLKQRFPHARVWGFEPDPKIFSALKANMEAFDLSNVTVEQKAVWTTVGEVHFALNGGASGRIDDVEDDSIPVDTVRLRDLLNEKEVDFLKIDIEGAEYQVLKDCADVLKNVKCLFVEYHSFNDQTQRLPEILNILTAAGFRYQIKEAFAAPSPFLERPVRLGMDLQLDIFAYRE